MVVTQKTTFKVEPSLPLWNEAEKWKKVDPQWTSNQELLKSVTKKRMSSGGHEEKTLAGVFWLPERSFACFLGLFMKENDFLSFFPLRDKARDSFRWCLSKDHILSNH